LSGRDRHSQSTYHKLSQTIFLHYFECKWHLQLTTNTCHTLMLKWERSASSISPFPAWIASMNLHESAHSKFLQNHKLLHSGTKYPQCLLQATHAIKERTSSSNPEIKASQGRKYLNTETKFAFSFLTRFPFCTKPQVSFIGNNPVWIRSEHYRQQNLHPSSKYLAQLHAQDSNLVKLEQLCSNYFIKKWTLTRFKYGFRTTLLNLKSEHTLLKMIKLKEHLIHEHPKILWKKRMKSERTTSMH